MRIKQLILVVLLVTIFACGNEWKLKEPRIRLTTKMLIVDQLNEGFYRFHFMYINTTFELRDMVVIFQNEGNSIKLIEAYQFMKPSEIDSTFNISNSGILTIASGLIIPIYPEDLVLNVIFNTKENPVFAAGSYRPEFITGGYWRINSAPIFETTNSIWSADYSVTYFIEKEAIF